jgi:hypothetical protein
MNYGTVDNPDGTKAVIIVSEGIKIKVDGVEPTPTDPEAIKEIIEKSKPIDVEL